MTATERTEPGGVFAPSEVDPAFGSLVDAFACAFADHGETGAALTVYYQGQLVADLVAGDHTDDTLQVVRSISKGVLSCLTHLLATSGVVDLDAPVSRYWPEFAAGGKGDIPVRWVMSHQAGLPEVDTPLSPVEGLRWTPAIDALQSQEPLWEPGTEHGYHDLTYGWLLGETLQRATGKTITALVEHLLRVPLGLELWMGLPLRELRRVRPLRLASPRASNQPRGGAAALARLDRVTRNPDFTGWEHRPEYLASPVPATNVVANARSLARLFAATIGPVGGVRLFDEQAIERALAVRADGPDAIVGWDRRYSDGFMLPDPTRPMGGIDSASFGYYGQGGSLAFADPSCDLSFAYVTVQEQLHLGPDPRTAPLAALARECAERVPGSVGSAQSKVAPRNVPVRGQQV